MAALTLLPLCASNKAVGVGHRERLHSTERQRRCRRLLALTVLRNLPPQAILLCLPPLQNEVISSLALRRQLSGSQELRQAAAQQQRSPRLPGDGAQQQQQQQPLAAEGGAGVRDSASFRTAQPGLRDSASFFTAQQTLASATASPPRRPRQLWQQAAAAAVAAGAAGLSPVATRASQPAEEMASPSPTSKPRPARAAGLGLGLADEPRASLAASSISGAAPPLAGAGGEADGADNEDGRLQQQLSFATPHASLMSLGASMDGGAPTPGGSAFFLRRA